MAAQNVGTVIGTFRVFDSKTAVYTAAAHHIGAHYLQIFLSQIVINIKSDILLVPARVGGRPFSRLDFC